MTQPSFTMMCCAHGAEKVVKSTMADDGWRLAFSRPGFVTAKHDDSREMPGGIFVRTAAHSIGHLKNIDGEKQIDGLRELLSSQPVGEVSFEQLHVWPRDRAPIGRFGFEPGIDEVSRAVAQQIHEALYPDHVKTALPNQIAQDGQRVLDVVLVDPSDWFIGWHLATSWPTRWPGGVQPIDPHEEPVSRAYFKAAEAITWSGFGFRPGDHAIEIGSAPGGACGRLLELGCRVTGIDPADMDPRIAGHKDFRHVRARAGDLPRREFEGARWLLVDSNVAPEKTLTTVDNIVRHRSCTLEGLLLTLKLGDYKKSDQIPVWIDKARQWDPEEIAVRQLARNRCEVCLAVRL